MYMIVYGNIQICTSPYVHVMCMQLTPLRTSVTSLLKYLSHTILSPGVYQFKATDIEFLSIFLRARAVNINDAICSKKG